MTQDEFVATLEEEPLEEPSPNNVLRESSVAEVQWNGKHISLLCTDAEEHEHLINPFNEQVNVQILDTFKDLFSNININSIQETYPNISVYNKIIVQYMEETNIKYGVNFKFTKLEAPELGIWAKTFQVAVHNENQQLPWKQPSKPSKPQPYQPPKQQAQQITQQPADQMALLMSEPQIAEQWAETNQMTGMAINGLAAQPWCHQLHRNWSGNTCLR